MSIFGISGLATGMLDLALSIVSLLHDYKSKINQHLALFVGAVSWWGFCVYQIAIIPASSPGQALIWWRIAHVGVILIPIFFFQFTYTFVELKKPWVLYVMYSLGAFFLISDATPYFIDHVSYVFNSFYYDSPPSVLYILFFIFYATLVAYAIYLLIKTYVAVSANKKQQALVILIGLAIAFSAGSTAYLPVFGIDILNPAFGTFLIPIAPVAFFYAIVRYRFLNARLIATELLTIGTWLVFALHIFSTNSIQERNADLLILIPIIGMGIFAIRSAIQESAQRDQLSDLSQHLQQKVDEQTAEVRKSYEVEKKARIELEQLDKDKDQFILATQHHLRTPLTIMRGYVESLINMPDEELATQAKPILQRTELATDRLSSLVSDLLDISQMQVGGDILKREEVSLKPLIEDILKDIKNEAEKRKVTENIDIEDIKLSLDRIKIRDAFSNLIDNAVKYCNEDGTVTIKGEKSGNIYKISFQDTGLGITPEELPRIFNQYFERGEEAEKMNKVGKGIGLVVTKKIVETHGGTIHVESAGRGKGSKFTVELPVTY